MHTSAISSSEILTQLALILRNELFAGSPRMARFLRFVVEEALAGRASQLKEVVVGTRVFDRQPSYDPRIDPIVRVEARRLRLKLGAYYDGPGAADPVVLELPKGQYAPVARSREPAPMVASEITIAVLPFSNFTAGGEAQYFSDGLTEDLIHALTRIRGVRIVGWESAVQLRVQQENIATVRQRLGAGFALRGSVRMLGTLLRVTAHLIQTGDGQYLWSETFDRQMADIFAIQQEIAEAIADALNLRFTGESRTAAVRDVESYQLCLKGRFQARDRTSEGVRRSLVLFEQAIARDPQSALAHSGMADVLTLMAAYGFAETSDMMERAKRSAEMALRLDAKSGEAWASFAMIVVLYDWDWEGGRRAFRKSIELNPGNVTAHFWYASDYLSNLGRIEEARASLERAIQLDPLSSTILSCRAFFTFLQRDYERALVEYEGIAQQDPSFYRAHSSMGRTSISMGRYRDAARYLRHARSLAGEVPNILGALGEAYALDGDEAAAREALADLNAIAKQRPVPASCFAFIHMGLGEMDEAMTWLERGVNRHQPFVVNLGVNPAYDPVRGESRFQALLERIGLDLTVR